MVFKIRTDVVGFTSSAGITTNTINRVIPLIPDTSGLATTQSVTDLVQDYFMALDARITTIENAPDSSSAIDSSMQSAAQKGQYDIVTYLQPYASSPGIDSAMQSAAANGHLNVVTFLHPYVSSPSALESAMQSAAANGHLDVVTFLQQEPEPQSEINSYINMSLTNRDTIITFDTLLQNIPNNTNMKVININNSLSSSDIIENPYDFLTTISNPNNSWLGGGFGFNVGGDSSNYIGGYTNRIGCSMFYINSSEQTLFAFHGRNPNSTNISEPLKIYRVDSNHNFVEDTIDIQPSMDNTGWWGAPVHIHNSNTIFVFKANGNTGEFYIYKYENSIWTKKTDLITFAGLGKSETFLSILDENKILYAFNDKLYEIKYDNNITFTIVKETIMNTEYPGQKVFIYPPKIIDNNNFSFILNKKNGTINNYYYYKRQRNSDFSQIDYILLKSLPIEDLNDSGWVNNYNGQPCIDNINELWYCSSNPHYDPGWRGKIKLFNYSDGSLLRNIEPDLLDFNDRQRFGHTTGNYNNKLFINAFGFDTGGDGQDHDGIFYIYDCNNFDKKPQVLRQDNDDMKSVFSSNSNVLNEYLIVSAMSEDNDNGVSYIYRQRSDSICYITNETSSLSDLITYDVTDSNGNILYENLKVNISINSN